MSTSSRSNGAAAKRTGGSGPSYLNREAYGPARSSSISSETGPSAAVPAPRQTSGSSIDSVVTRLLVSTKTLLEGLTQWSTGACSDDRISDIYVKLGNDFNAACAGFARESIPMEYALPTRQDSVALIAD